MGADEKKRPLCVAISHWRVVRHSHFLVSRWLPGNSTTLTVWCKCLILSKESDIPACQMPKYACEWYSELYSKTDFNGSGMTMSFNHLLQFLREVRCPCVARVCACLRRCVYLSVTLRSYITAPNRKALGSLQRAQDEPSTAADGMSLSYLALCSFTSPPPSVSPPLVDACTSPGPPLREISQKTLDVLQNL